MDARYFLVLGAGALAIVLLFYFSFIKGKKTSRKWFIEKKVSGGKKGTSNPTKFSGKCEFCGKAETLPFKCKFCGQFHCSTHRLPESHNCPGLGAFRRGV